MRLLILRVRAPEQGWCRQVSLRHRDVQVRVLSCFPLASGEFLEDVGLEGAGWRTAYHDAMRTANIVDASITRDEAERGRVQFRVKACPLIETLAETGTLPRFPFRVVAGHDYWVFVSRHQDAPKLLNRLKAARVQAEVVFSGPFEEPAGLTPRQTEVLARAVEEGYYDYPRRISLTKLAQRLGVAKSTLSEALVMVEREVVRRYVGRGDHVLPGPEFPPHLERREPAAAHAAEAME
ncbi:MAG: helix-turn-helix domain-containing protein, partial [Euryarchaeota archaeon]|nr:helix-turn-helix domain-containing protein [Euryarchaeota archaeon]